MIKLTIKENEANQRLDRFLRKYFKKATLSAVYKMIRKDIKVNGKRAKEDTMLNLGDEVALYMSEERFNELSAPVKKKPVKRQFKIAYEDDNILIVEKPWGLMTHGDAYEKKNTLANQVAGYLQEKGEYDPAVDRTFTPSPVNRLDRNTTGLVIFGKNAETLRSLTKLIRERNCIEKYYTTIVAGSFKEEMVFSDKLAKDHETNTVAVSEDGKESLTYVYPMFTGKRFSIVEIKLITGRTHQIRVHLSNAGYPLMGDPKYGRRDINLHASKMGVTTQLLHAYKLKFSNMPEHLSNLEGKTVEAQLPQEFNRVKKLILAEHK